MQESAMSLDDLSGFFCILAASALRASKARLGATRRGWLVYHSTIYLFIYLFIYLIVSWDIISHLDIPLNMT